MIKQTLSIIMPALNEENNIEAAIYSTLNAFEKHGIDGEVIVINDGSTDNTGSIVESIIEKINNVKLINHDKPKGIGFSFWDGVKHSDKDIVAMFPGDNENNPDDAFEFLGLMDNVDIIVPFVHNVEVREKIRRLISSLYRFIVNMSFGININYFNGTVFYRRVILKDIELSNFGFFYQAEILIKLIRKGYLFAETPTFLGIRKNGDSKALTIKSLIQVIKGYLRLAFDIHIRAIEAKGNYKKLNKNSVSFRKHFNRLNDQEISEPQQ